MEYYWKDVETQQSNWQKSDEFDSHLSTWNTLVSILIINDN